MSELDLGGSARSGMALGQSIAEGFLVLFRVLIRPLVLVTQVLFRKTMGERYFTPANALIGICLIVLATIASSGLKKAPGGSGTPPWSTSSSTNSLSSQPGLSSFDAAANRFVEALQPSMVVGGVWTLLILVAAYQQYQFLRRRYAAEQRWHSRNTGIARVPGIGPRAEFAISLAAAGILAWLGILPVAGLMALSAILSMASDAIAARDFKNRVLDAIDAEIEAEHLANAIRQRTAPEHAEGLQVPTRAFATGTIRNRLAASFEPKPSSVIEAKQAASAVSVSTDEAASALV